MRTKLWSLVSCRQAALATCGFALLTAGAASAEDAQDFEDFFGGYTHRVEGVTVGVGDAPASNAASQIINPWPAYSRDRRILSESQRMIGAVQRYQNNSGAKSTIAQTTSQSRDAAGSGAQDDKNAAAAPDTATPRATDTSSGE